LALHLAGMAEDEEPIPEPASLDAVMADRENRDAVAILVKAPPATAKAVRVNMTIPEDELEQIDKFAAEHGYTRSGFLLHAAKRAIGEAATRRTDTDLTAKMMRLEAKVNAAGARTDFASVKAGEADPLKRLAELVEISYAAEAVKKAIDEAMVGPTAPEEPQADMMRLEASLVKADVEAKSDPLEALAELVRLARPTPEQLRAADALQKVIEARLTNEAKAEARLTRKATS
jgi:hypothetical protein